MIRKTCVICIVVLLAATANLVFAEDKADSRTTISESVLEILNSINEIIRSSIAIAEAELKELQRELRKKGIRSRSRLRNRLFRRSTRRSLS